MECFYRDADLVRRIGAATALEVKASGIHYNFAPCVAVRHYNQLVIECMNELCQLATYAMLHMSVLTRVKTRTWLNFFISLIFLI